MTHSHYRGKQKRERGAALITVLLISVTTALLLGASLLVTLSSSKLGWKQARTESALQLANAGVNSELQYIAMNQSQATVTLRSSQPVAATGVTAQYPGENFTIKGRQGSVPGFTGNFYVYSSNDSAGATAWDGVTSPFYITSSALINGVWQRVQVTTQTSSLFNLYGTYVTGSYGGSPPPTTCDANGSIVVTGPAGINGQISTGSGCTVSTPHAVNGNGCTYSSGQFTSSHVASGGDLVKTQTPFVFPTCADIIRRTCGHQEYSDDDCFRYQSNHCNNNTGCYTYRSDANDDSICTRNCKPVTGGCGNVLNNADFQNCGTHPGTYTSSGYYYWWFYQAPTTAVQTMIFEPGDYYFNSVQLAYAASCECVIDSQAYASGGTPGQVRFWICPTGSGDTDDNISLPITHLPATGQSDPDCGLFRIYCCKDGHSCNFNRPGNCSDWQGNTVTGDFEYKCGVYSCTKKPDQVPTSDGSGCQPNPNIESTKTGCTVHLTGQTNRSGGCCKITGSCLTDKLKCTGGCTLNFKQSVTCTSDPCSGGKCLSWCKK